MSRSIMVGKSLLTLATAVGFVSCLDGTGPGGQGLATIQGAIRDETGAGVLGVKIRIINSNIIHDILSDSSGNFVLRDVTPGVYDLNIYTPANYRLAATQQNPIPISVAELQTYRPNISVVRAPGTPAAPGVGYVQVVNFLYNPSAVRVNVGGTVTWQNFEPDFHTVTSEIGDVMNSGILRRTNRYVKTFDTPGQFTYHCTFHEQMQGVVIVDP
jgi:plastocyanin